MSDNRNEKPRYDELLLRCRHSRFSKKLVCRENQGKKSFLGDLFELKEEVKITIVETKINRSNVCK